VEIPLIGWLERAVDRWFDARAATRRFEAEQIDQVLAVLDWTTDRCVDLLMGQLTGKAEPPDAPYADAAAIRSEPTVGRLLELHDQVRQLEESGRLASLEADARAALRMQLIQAMEDVRAAAAKRRRRYGKAG
jgi:hypothetical protein